MDFLDLKIAYGVEITSHNKNLINVIGKRILIGTIENESFFELNGDEYYELDTYNYIDNYELGNKYSYIFPITVRELLKAKRLKEEDLNEDLLMSLACQYQDDIANHLYFHYVDYENDTSKSYIGDSNKEFSLYAIDFEKNYYEAYRELKKAQLSDLKAKRALKEEKIEETLNTPKISEEITTFKGAVRILDEEEPVKVDADFLEKALKERIIAQDDACEALIDAYDRNSRYGNYEGMKSNILIIGPSGVGKTEMSKSLAALTDKPIVIFDVTRCTSAGYVGDNVVSCLRQLINKSGNDLIKAEEGIVVLDEIDKLASSDNGETIAKQDVQYELLKMLDGGLIEVPMGGGYNERMITLDTSRITFIGSGAFSSLYKEKAKRTIGFNKRIEYSPATDKKDISTEDLAKFGLEPELLRRFSVRIVMNNLSKEDLKKILMDSKISSLNMYKTSLLKENKVKLVFTDEAIDAVIDFASEHQGGASGLKGAVDHTMTKAVRSVGRIKDEEEKELIIDKETVADPSQYKIKVLKKKTRK